MVGGPVVGAAECVALEHGASVVGAFVVGAVVGADDGRTVGVSVGAVVGTFVGADDGRELGACEGLTVGDWVGAFVVGVDEGTDDGGAMGAFVVGADEGANDGLPDGVSVGAVVLHSISFTTLAACSEATAIVGRKADWADVLRTSVRELQPPPRQMAPRWHMDRAVPTLSLGGRDFAASSASLLRNTPGVCVTAECALSPGRMLGPQE